MENTVPMVPQENTPSLTRGHYGPIVNYTFGAKIAPFKHPKLDPFVAALKEQLRGKSGFARLQGLLFYKSGEFIELVDDETSVPESEKIIDLDKKSQGE